MNQKVLASLLFVAISTVLVKSERQAHCLEPMPYEKGWCAQIHRYHYFDSETKKCELYDFVGCGVVGRNKFKYLDDCIKDCESVDETTEIVTETTEIVSVPSERPGNISGLTETTEIVSGPTEEPGAHCLEPKPYGEGVCAKWVPAYYYDPNWGLCWDIWVMEKAVGSNNNFATLEECENTCGKG